MAIAGSDTHEPPDGAADDPVLAARWLERNTAESLPAGGLEKRLAQAGREGRALRVKLGIDPTAPDIHLGFTVVLGKLREFQELGHDVVLIIGDWTALIGDPSGRSATRPMLTPEEIAANASTFADQAMTVLREDRLEVRRNSEWLDMDVAELFRILRTTTVAQVTEREDIASRLETGSPVSMLELLYPVMQGYDSVAVRSDVELGGTDQHFNLLLGRDLQRAFGQPEQIAMEMPILTGTDGVKKMSKSLGNYIGVTEEPAEIYGKTMSIPDESLDEWYRLLLDVAVPPDATPRDAKRHLGRALVERFKGSDAAESAEAHFDSVIVRGEPPAEIESAVFTAGSDGIVHVPAVLADAFGVSRSEARRALSQGSVKLDGAELSDLDVDAKVLDGRIVQMGKRRHRRLARG